MFAELTLSTNRSILSMATDLHVALLLRNHLYAPESRKAEGESSSCGIRGSGVQNPVAMSSSSAESSKSSVSPDSGGSSALPPNAQMRPTASEKRIGTASDANDSWFFK